MTDDCCGECVGYIPIVKEFGKCAKRNLAFVGIYSPACSEGFEKKEDNPDE